MEGAARKVGRGGAEAHLVCGAARVVPTASTMKLLRRCVEEIFGVV